MQSAADRLAGTPLPPAIEPGWAPEDPARLALRSHAAAQARAFLAADPRNGSGGPAATMAMGVAAWRLRTMLRVFGTLVDTEWAAGISAELRWIIDLLAAAQDRQAVLDRLGHDLDELGDSDGARRARHLLQRRLARELGQIHADVGLALRSPRYRSLADRLSVLGADLPATAAGERPCREALPPPVLDAYRRLSQTLEPLTPQPPADGDAAWQEARLAAEQARYAAEFCGPVFGQQAKALARQLERVTEILGRHQDATTASRVASAAATTPRIAPSTSFALGVLHATERAAVAIARRDLADAWPEVNGKRWRRWLIHG